VSAERVVLDYVKSGKVDAKGFARVHQECREMIEKLARKLKAR
jgi:hypothetical protein